MPLISEPIDYSIVICVCNPDERLFKRCLDSVARLDISGLTTEVILVDNDSKLPLNSLHYVKDFLTKVRSVKTIMVAAHGVKNARLG